MSGADAAIKEKSQMKTLSRILSAAGLALGLALAAVPAGAQQPAAQPAAPLKPASPAAIAAAKDLLNMKGVSGIYAAAVPNIVQRAKDQLLANNLNYQKDLNEIAAIIAQSFAGREKEIGEQMARIYASDFTEQELKDLNAFYKTPVGQKLLVQEPKSVQASMTYMQQWAQNFSETVLAEFRSEMKKRGKPLS